jgi:hypothetical protein
VEATRVVAIHGRSALSADSVDAAVGGDDAVCNDGRAGGADDRDGSDEVSDAADMAECLHDDAVCDG